MRIQIPLLAITLLAVSGCNLDLWEDDDDTSRSDANTSLVVFDPDGLFESGIHWTDLEIAHFSAYNLERLAFGSELANARDNYWLSIGLAGTIDEFEQAFRSYDGMTFVNAQ